MLRLTAQLISQMLPSNADIYRLDGDEFGIIILNGKEGEALKVFDNIRNKFCRSRSLTAKNITVPFPPAVRSIPPMPTITWIC